MIAPSLETLDEEIPRLRIDESLELERPHVLLRGFVRVAEHQFQERVCRQRLRRSAGQRADIPPSCTDSNNRANASGGGAVVWGASARWRDYRALAIVAA